MNKLYSNNIPHIAKILLNAHGFSSQLDILVGLGSAIHFQYNSRGWMTDRGTHPHVPKV